ncbi:TPA: HNH endonuclease [Klebsiella michiganensis]|nr:HNH endonuclease [Klebsiella michiganensis]
MKLTKKRLKDMLRYEPETGNFYWSNPTAHRMHNGELAGFIDYNGYVYIKVDSKRYSAHRLAWLYVHGQFPSEMIDHINTIRSDNRISNLRKATRSQNMMNQATRKNSNSGVKGVGWDKKSQKWRARCQVDGIRKSIGFFDSIEEAKNFLVIYRNQVHGEFANHGGPAA